MRSALPLVVSLTITGACHGQPTIVQPDAGDAGSNAAGAAGVGGGASGASGGSSGTAGSSGAGGSAGALLDAAAGFGGTTTDGGADAVADSGADASDGSPDGGGGTTDAAIDAAPTCGDKIVEGDEECDDGNQALNDACDADCRVLDAFFLVPNLTQEKVELYDDRGVYLRDFIVDDGTGFVFSGVATAIQLEDGTVLLSEMFGDRITRWSRSGAYLGIFASAQGARGMDTRDGDLLVAASSGIEVFDLATGAKKANLSNDTDLIDVLVLPTSWLLTSQLLQSRLELRAPDGTAMGVLATGNSFSGTQVTWTPDGRMLWAVGNSGQVFELHASVDPPSDAGTRVDADGIDFDVPSPAGRSLNPGGKPIGVVELASGNWFVTTSTSVGGVYDPATGQKLSSTPGMSNRRQIKPFYAPAECVAMASDAGADGGADGGLCP